MPGEQSLQAHFRRGTPADALCVGALAIQVFLDTYATAGLRPDLAREALGNCGPDAFARRLAQPSTHFVLAELNLHLIGFAELGFGGGAPDPALDGGVELVRLYVQSHFKGQGIGRALLAEAERLATAHGAGGLWLAAWTANAPALAFYAAQGYADIGSTQYVFEGNAYENRLLMRRLAAAR